MFHVDPTPSMVTFATVCSEPLAFGPVGPVDTVEACVFNVAPFSTCSVAFVVPPGVPKLFGGFVNTAALPTTKPPPRFIVVFAPVSVRLPVDPAAFPT